MPRTRSRAPGVSGAPSVLPAHVGVVMDGNRRWARVSGHRDARIGHHHGADHVEDLLGWCSNWGIEHPSTYVLSADNIRKRSRNEVDYLFDLLATRIPEVVLRSDRWTLHVSGDLDLLPSTAREALTRAQEATAGRPAHVTMAIGYDGRGDIVEGIRTALAAHGPDIDADMITAGLSGGPVKEIDLVIRTSGEHRLSGFFPWQTARSEIYVTHKLWPDLTAADFADALHFFAERRRGQSGP